ncbi:HET-domain-containing protein, partial [Stipitochalara longipes BDJ]
MRAKWKKAKRRHHKSRRAHHKALASVPTNSLYEPLPSKSSIRLITLHPGDFNDSIRCTLEVFELASVPSYEAISYVWGDPTPRNRIRCNGRRYLIGDNLNDTIRRVRSKDEPRVIWVDALCIDQVNLGERSHQVLLMRDVYSRTRRTLICL